MSCPQRNCMFYRRSQLMRQSHTRLRWRLWIKEKRQPQNTQQNLVLMHEPFDERGNILITYQLISYELSRRNCDWVFLHVCLQLHKLFTVIVCVRCLLCIQRMIFFVEIISVKTPMFSDRYLLFIGTADDQLQTDSESDSTHVLLFSRLNFISIPAATKNIIVPVSE